MKQKKQTTKEKEPETISEYVSNSFAAYAVMATASDLLLRQTELAMLKDKISFKKERKKVITELQQSIRRTEYLGNRFVDEVCTNSGQEFIGAFDALLGDAHLIVALIMRYYNATYGSDENWHKIADYLKELKLRDLFTEEQIAKFEKIM